MCETSPPALATATAVAIMDIAGRVGIAVGKVEKAVERDMGLR